MHQPDDKQNFVIEVTPAVYTRIKQELGDAFLDNMTLHYSPYWSRKNDSDIEDLEAPDSVGGD